MSKIKEVHYTLDFKKSYEQLPARIQVLADKKDGLFRENPLHLSLQTHKLKGPLQNLWSFYVNKSYCVLFEFLSNEKVIFYDIGTHEIYK